MIESDMSKRLKKINKATELMKLYLRCHKTLQFCGEEITVKSAPDGVDSITAFIAYDSEGKILSCKEGKEAERFRKVLFGKKALNLHITALWGPAAYACTIPIIELMDDYPWMPEWVWDAVRGQIKKHYAKNPYPYPWGIGSLYNPSKPEKTAKALKENEELTLDRLYREGWIKRPKKSFFKRIWIVLKKLLGFFKRKK